MVGRGSVPVGYQQPALSSESVPSTPKGEERTVGLAASTHVRTEAGRGPVSDITQNCARGLWHGNTVVHLYFTKKVKAENPSSHSATLDRPHRHKAHEIPSSNVIPEKRCAQSPKIRGEPLQVRKKKRRCKASGQIVKEGLRVPIRCQTSIATGAYQTR